MLIYAMQISVRQRKTMIFSLKEINRICKWDMHQLGLKFSTRIKMKNKIKEFEVKNILV